MTALAPFDLTRVRFESLQRLMQLMAQTAGRAILQVNAAGEAGSIFVDDGRVAWAAVPRTRRYLSERLEAVGVPKALVERTRLARRPLSQLISEGNLSRETFEQVLFEHTLESVRHLLTRPLIAVEIVPWTGEAPPHSFPAIALLCAALGRAPTQLTPPAAEDFVAVRAEQRGAEVIPVQHWGRVPPLSEALELMSHGAAVMRRLGSGTASFRRGARCWSVSGTSETFTVCAGSSPLSFSWMLGQSS